MSYDATRDRRTYVFQQFDYGAATTWTDRIVGPKGKAGRLVDYGVMSVQETFAGATTGATISIGTNAAATAFGAAFSLQALTTTLGGKTVQQTWDPRIPAQKTSFDATITAPTLTADTPIAVVSTGGTGGPSGQAAPYVVIDWDL